MPTDHDDRESGGAWRRTLPGRVLLLGCYGALLFFVWYLVPRLRLLLGAPRASLWQDTRRFCRTSLALFGVRLEIAGIEHVDPRQAYVFVANHRSWFDQLALVAAVPQRLHFLAKEAYFDMPVLGAILRLHGQIPVPRWIGVGGGRALLGAQQQAVASGGSLVIFPEGTRANGDELLPFQPGAFRSSAALGLPILPVFLFGSDEVLWKGASWLSIKPGVIRLVFRRARAPIQRSPHERERQARDFEQQFREEYRALRASA